MDKTAKVIRVGFIVPTSKAWMGGVNYFKNLFFAINSLQQQNVEFFIFIGKKADREIKEIFYTYKNVIEDSIFDRKSIKWILNKTLEKTLSSNIILEKLLKKYNIEILSHTFIKNLKHCKTIDWIPDFQHIHLPDMFSEKDIKHRNRKFLASIEKADKIILSSHDALQDFKKFSPENKNKAVILQFVSQPEKNHNNFTKKDLKNLLEKYDIPEEFYFVPNQFWKHKNHMVILEAVKILKDEGINISIVFSGHMGDPRHKNHIFNLQEYINNNKLKNNIFFLGIIDYEDVFKLIKFSKSVINPSLFEGWSSIVEECKSTNKNMILSDINVHKEQYPNATFFDRHSAISLKEILSNYTFIQDIPTEEDCLEKRTRVFGEQYLNIIKDVYYE